MLVPILYAIPSLWFGALVTFWLNASFGWVVASLPVALVAGMNAAALYVFIVGVLLVLVGLSITTMEVTKNYQTPYNVDALLCFIGSLFIVLAFQVSPEWLQWLGYGLTTLFFALPSAIALVRFMVVRTQTAMGSLLVFAGYCMVLSLWTIVTFD